MKCRLVLNEVKRNSFIRRNVGLRYAQHQPTKYSHIAKFSRYYLCEH